MSIRGEPKCVEFPLIGATVLSARQFVDECGYGVVELHFADGRKLRVEEFSQTGELQIILKVDKSTVKDI